ncbi:hypothetical protein EX30DRAFT_376697 [Ascodesmis nigricans]|uniref:Ribosomal RNA-processing protein 40 n=1 Tax=Ascodesmis nigricans TaxID=341454 RepID=A0A4S2N740_9PEZI|nr:hypothetical protein EX30DRAFT_376697 [Ascodesmis nigricans]
MTADYTTSFRLSPPTSIHTTSEPTLAHHLPFLTLRNSAPSLSTRLQKILYLLKPLHHPTMSTVLLPGSPVSLPPTNTSVPLRLGPGLTHTPPSTITAHHAGTLTSDTRKNALWIPNLTRRYTPLQNDRVICTILRSSGEAYIVAIPSSNAPAPTTITATLPHLAFPGATKKTRPQLSAGATVYARISLANKHYDPELECVDEATGKAGGLGELKGGMVVGVRCGRDWGPVLRELGKVAEFEVAVGKNGRIWVEGKDRRTTMWVVRRIAECDENTWTVEEMRKKVEATKGDL